MSLSPIRQRAEEILRALVGREDARLREDQWRAIEALVVDRRRALVVERTGWGKSAVYFVATALLREGWGPGSQRAEGASAGTTIIISPLLALMRDQIKAASRAGLAAETINSANATQWEEIEERVRGGEVDLLLVSPDGPVPEILREPTLRVLGQLEERLDNSAASGPRVVVLVGSRRHPERLRHLGNAVAQTLGARPLGILEPQGEVGRHDTGSAFRLAHVAGEYSLAQWSTEQVAGLKGAQVVLVDDYADSGWTLTYVARVLREAGAASVMPFVLGARGN